MRATPFAPPPFFRYPIVKRRALMGLQCGLHLAERLRNEGLFGGIREGDRGGKRAKEKGDGGRTVCYAIGCASGWPDELAIKLPSRLLLSP